MATKDSVMAVIRASRPNFRNPSDKLGFAVHASFLAAGYYLIATGARASSENPPTDGDEVGIEGWNEFEDSYAFVYLKSDKGQRKPILVKCLAIGDALVVDVLNLQEDKKEPFHIQINMKDHLLEGDNKSNYGDMYKNLQGLVDSFNAGIFNKLEPKTESSGSRSESSSGKEPVSTYPVRRQQPPVLRYPPVPSSGGRNLFPGPGAGVFPDRGRGIGGGMLVGPDDPRWFSLAPPGTGFSGSDMWDGAHDDPIGPPHVPGFEPERFIRNPPRNPGRGGGIHPDLHPFHGPPDYV